MDTHINRQDISCWAYWVPEGVMSRKVTRVYVLCVRVCVFTCITNFKAVHTHTQERVKQVDSPWLCLLCACSSSPCKWHYLLLCPHFLCDAAFRSTSFSRSFFFSSSLVLHAALLWSSHHVCFLLSRSSSSFSPHLWLLTVFFSSCDSGFNSLKSVVKTKFETGSR